MDKLSAWSLAAAGIILALVAGGYLLFVKQYPVGPVPSPTPDGIFCTADAKLCPDGSAVGRTGPNCEFAPCPGETDTSNWQTYRNEEYGFEIKYPGDWRIEVSAKARFFQLFNYPADKYDGSEWFDDGDTKIDFSIAEGNAPEGPPYKEVQFGQNIGHISIVADEFGGSEIKILYLLGDGEYLSAFFYGDHESQVKITDQILSTFKFIAKAGGQFCGGIAGIICQDGYECQYEGKYPDAGGTCVKTAR